MNLRDVPDEVDAMLSKAAEDEHQPSNSFVVGNVTTLAAGHGLFAPLTSMRRSFPRCAVRRAVLAETIPRCGISADRRYGECPSRRCWSGCGDSGTTYEGFPPDESPDGREMAGHLGAPATETAVARVASFP